MFIEQEVLEVLSRAQTNGNALILVDQLDRRMYEKTNKILEACGGTWMRKAKAHVFDTDAADRIDQILLSGEVAVPKDEFNFFPTPPAVVARLLELAGDVTGKTMLEPEVGRGDIALPFAKAGAIVSCFELMDANYQHMAGNPLLHSVIQGDFLLQPPVADFDLVIMNPPFLKQSDIKHVTHALKFLKPKGLLLSVMGANVTFRSNQLTQDFRDLVRSRNGEIEALPEGSFKLSGTMVNTVIVSIPAE